ncbi:MAG TPA: hypothetical protein DCY20_00670 [Firmicutes bacterium]|nr:hypothetical protein [Bacillota bacterium]
MKLYDYNRDNAVNYARKWALSRNRAYNDYEKYGGDCTNYISQCLFAGGIPFDTSGRDMTQKWYWYSDSARSPSWTSASAFRRYFMSKQNTQDPKTGLVCQFIDKNQLEIGDLVQKKVDGALTHTMIITGFVYDDNGNVIDYLLCQHSDDFLDLPLSQKVGELSYIKILGYYK